MMSSIPRQGWALVTGACSGIGFEIARELAARGYALVLVSEQAARLHEAAEALTRSFAISTQTVVLDLADPGAARSLREEIDRRGIDIEILVSNAGMFFYGDVADADPDRMDTMLHLHVITPSLLAVEFAGVLRARRRGRILIVSSLSAWRDFPDIACYGASKRYLRSFSASLRDELAPWGVTVTCLAPGATATGLYNQTTIPVELAVKWRVMKNPAEVAHAGVCGMLAGTRVVMPGVGAKLMAVGMTLLPRPLIRRLHRAAHERRGDMEEKEL